MDPRLPTYSCFSMHQNYQTFPWLDSSFNKDQMSVRCKAMLSVASCCINICCSWKPIIFMSNEHGKIISESKRDRHSYKTRQLLEMPTHLKFLRVKRGVQQSV